MEKDKSFSIHHNLSLCIMNNIFKVDQTVPYDLRKRNVLQSRNSSSVRYGTETISYIAPKIWSLAIKNCESLKSFKQKIRKWKPDCPCRLCKVYCNMLVSSNS